MFSGCQHFRNIINKHKFTDQSKRQNTEWTEERKQKHSESIKRFWEDKNKRAK